MSARILAIASCTALLACGAPPLPGESDDAGIDVPDASMEEVESQFDGGEVPEDLPDDDGGTIIDEPDASTPLDAGTRDAGTRDAGTPATCVEYTTRHLQASMQKTDSVTQMNQAIDKAFLNPDGISPDTISWTEIENQSQVTRIHTKAGWDTYWPHQPSNPDAHPANYVPVSWKTSVYSFVSGSSEKSSDGRAGVTPHLYITRVRLKHRASGADVMRVAMHAVAGIDTLNDNVAYRKETHAKNVTSFNKYMKTATLPVIGSGDFNTTRFPAMLKAENADVQPYLYDVPSSGGSLGSRLIDWVVHRKSDNRVYVFGASSFVDLSPTDHKGVRSRFTFRPPPCQ